MKKIYVLLGLIVFYCLLAVAMHQKISIEKLEGTWNVKVTDAPYSYQDYVIDIKEDKGEYKADVLFVEDRYKILEQTFTLKDGKLTGNVITNDGENVDITIWEKKGIVQGVAKSKSRGDMQMTFVRAKD